MRCPCMSPGPSLPLLSFVLAALPWASQLAGQHRPTVISHTLEDCNCYCNCTSTCHCQVVDERSWVLLVVVGGSLTILAFGAGIFLGAGCRRRKPEPGVNLAVAGKGVRGATLHIS